MRLTAFTSMLLALSLVACSSTPSSPKVAPEKKAPAATEAKNSAKADGPTFNSTMAGPLRLGEKVPDTLFKPEGPNYETYWDNGYFGADDLRVFHLDILDVVALVSPKHRLYRVFLGPRYTSRKGISLASSFKDLKAAHPDLVLKTEKIPPSWMYRPDKIQPYNKDFPEPGRGEQIGSKPLNCVATAASFPHVEFYFEDCAQANGGGAIEAISVVSDHTADLDHIDPFVDLEKVPPCPQTTVTDPDALAQEADRVLNHQRMGEYYRNSAVQKSMPMFRQAALAGSISAAYSYSGLIFRYIHQDVIGDPLNRTVSQGAQEGMLFLMMSLLRENKPSEQGECARAVLDFSKALDKSLFRYDENNEDDMGPCHTRYSFEFFSLKELEGLRQQAKAWSTCWPEKKR